MEEIKQEKGDMSAVYEASYILLPSLAFEQVPAKAAAIKSMLTSAGGAVISDEDPVLIDLAYPMTKVISTFRHKATTGYFGWIKFEITSDGIGAVKKALDADDDIIRHLIIRTVRENTLLNGKMKLQKEQARDDEVVEDEALKEVAPDEAVKVESEVIAE
jgi:ribosomal protein S6